LSAPQEDDRARLGRPKKWPGDAVIMTVYIPLDLKREIEKRARAKHMTVSEYVVSLLLNGLEADKNAEAVVHALDLMLKGLEAERAEKEAMQNAEAKKVP
jgi:hypothetical protein